MMTNQEMGEELDKMFAEMRFNIEGDLLELAKRYPDKISTCPSQSMRASQVLRLVDEDLNGRIGTGMETERMKLFRYRNRLEDFIAVHKTITMLERRYRSQVLIPCGDSKGD